MGFLSRHPVTAIVLTLVMLAGSVYQWRQYDEIAQLNRLQQHPQSIDLAQEALPPPLIMAKAYQFSRERRFQEAVRVYLQAKAEAGSDLTALIEYNLGTAYLRQAAEYWRERGVWEYDKINTLLDLAENSFRKVLLAQPEHADARYNLEYALSIRPPAREVEKSDWQGRKSSVFATLPGMNGGGP